MATSGKIGSHSLVLNGTSEYLTLANHTDWYIGGSDDFIIEMWVTFDTLGTTQYLYNHWGTLSYLKGRRLYKNSSNNIVWKHSANGSNEFTLTSFNTITDNDWHHIAVHRESATNVLRLYIDGVYNGSIGHNEGTPAIGQGLVIGADPSYNSKLDGVIDEFRIVRAGTISELWTSAVTPYTPPSSPYASNLDTKLLLHVDNNLTDSGNTGHTVTFNGNPSPTYIEVGDEILSIEESMSLNDSWDVYATGVFTNVNDIINISDTWNIRTNPESKSISETINISDVWDVHLAFEEAIIPDTVVLDDSWLVNISDPIHFPSTIISHNPLVMVTNTSPAKLFQIDISVPAVPTWIGYTLTGASYAKDVAYNALTDEYFVACADGIIVKVDASSPNTQTLVDLNDTDNLEKIASLDSFHKVYAGTGDANGEVITLQDADISSLNTNFAFVSKEEYSIDTTFDTIFASIVNSDFRTLSVNRDSVSTDFRYLYTEDIENPGNPSPTPYAHAPFNMIKRTDFDVKIDNVSVPDIKLDSIVIAHTVDEQSQAQFVLGRKHDRLNHTEEGVSSEITNGNAVKIYIKGRLEFEGNIGQVRSSSEDETVTVICLGDEQQDVRKIVNLPLSQSDTQIHPYDILFNNPIIENPTIGEDEENPRYYKGVKASYGDIFYTGVTTKGRIETLYTPESESTSKQLVDGTFKFVDGATYFWENLIADNLISKQKADSDYLGTSLSPLSNRIYDVKMLDYKQQMIDAEVHREDVGYYEVGDEPRKEINVANGRKFQHVFHEDREDGLWQVFSDWYNYIGETKFNPETGETEIINSSRCFVGKVAQAEYEKMLTTAGSVLPKTSGDLSLAIDGYYFYDIGLLTRMNITNTTTTNIYNNNNGFPVSVKAITISSATMLVTMNTDNSLSSKELDEIDASLPDENDDLYRDNSREFRRKNKYFDDKGSIAKFGSFNSGVVSDRLKEQRQQFDDSVKTKYEGV